MNKRALMKVLAAIPLACLGSLTAITASAQDSYPNRPVRLLVGFSAGGPTDNAARLLSVAMGKVLGQSVTVQNIPGANSLLAVNELMRSKPDGYTVLLATNGSLTVAPSRVTKLPYDAKRDFAFIGPMVAYPHVLVVPNTSPASDFPSFLNYARSEKGQLNAASVGHVNDLTIEWLNKLTKSKFTRIPYRGDSAVVNDLVSNRVDFALLAPNVAMPLVEGKKIKAIALTAPGGSAVPESIKTIKDSGIPEFEMEIWNCLVAPAGTPPEIIAKIASALRKAQENTDVQSSLAVSGQHIFKGTAEMLVQRIERETAQWQRVVREANLPMLEQ